MLGTAIDPEEDPLQENREGFEIVRIRNYSEFQSGIRQIPYFLSFAYQVYKAIGKGGFNIVHCHDYLCLQIGVIIKLLQKKPLVYDAHEIYWLTGVQSHPKILSKFIQYSEFALLNAVDTFITVGKTRLEYYKDHYKKEIQIIGNWYDPQKAKE